ncbi:MAG: CoA transferase [Roseovarius sp.]|nr:CoA transferase [Roseovarius sp.]
MTQPSDDILALDFATLLAGRMATLMLAEAGVGVIRPERPDAGEDMRLTKVMIEDRSQGYAILNRGKKSNAPESSSVEVKHRAASELGEKNPEFGV